MGKIGHMKNLKILWACDSSSITYDDIDKLNLTELYAIGNSKITIRLNN
jgi:hypothetical protein